VIALSLVAAAAVGLGVAGSWGAGIVVGLSLSGAAFAAQLLLFGWTGPQSDLLLLLAAVPLLLRPRAPAAPRLGRAPWPLALAVGLAAVAVAALFVEHSIRYPDGGWDARAIWNLRARSLFAAPRELPLSFAPDFPHADYPPLLPALVAHGWFALGRRWEPVPIVLSALFALGGTAALSRSVATLRGKTAACAAVLLLLGTPDFLILAWNQYADLKLAMLLLAAAALATEGRYAAAGLASGLAALTKNEGLVEAALLLGVVCWRAGPRALSRMLAGAALPLAFLLWFKLNLAPRNDLAERFVLERALRTAPLRIFPVIRAFALQAVDFELWGAALFAVAAGWLWRFRRREPALVAAPFAALCLLLYFVIFLFTPQELAWHVRTSLDRLLFQAWPLLLYASADLWPRLKVSA
jgi:hypothetical protein